jgi:hypothetical protein
LTIQMPLYINYYGLSILLMMGIIGLLILYKMNREQFKLFSFFVGTIIFVQYIFGDISRGLQYAALPLAILSGLTIQKGYNYLTKYSFNLKLIFILLLLLISLIGTFPFFNYLVNSNTHWDELNIPFEGSNYPLKEYIEKNTNSTDVIWTDGDISDLAAWMTGRRISNGRKWGNGPPKDFEEQHQNINVYISNDSFIIKNYDNKSVTQIKISPFLSHNSLYTTKLYPS